jgi:hypothetical protein
VELQRHEARAEELRVQLEQALQRRVDLARRALRLGLLDGRLALALRRALSARLLLLLRALVAAALVVLPGRAGLARFTRFTWLARLAGGTRFMRLARLLRGRFGALARVRLGTGLQLLQLVGHVQLRAPGRACVRLGIGGGSVGHAGGAVE